jgi:hypothetical protein
MKSIEMSVYEINLIIHFAWLHRVALQALGLMKGQSYCSHLQEVCPGLQ